jgi:hypothetical protein
VPTSARGPAAQCQVRPMLSAHVWPMALRPACCQAPAGTRARHTIRVHGAGGTVTQGDGQSTLDCEKGAPVRELLRCVSTLYGAQEE